MSFLKTDGLVFEDEEELDNELEDEEADEETETDDETPDEESPEDEDDGEDDEEEQLRILKMIQDRREKNQLKKIKNRVMKKIASPFISPEDIPKLLKLEKKHKDEVRKIFLLAATKEATFQTTTTTVGTSVVAAGGWIPILIGIAIIVLVVIIATIMPWLFPDDENGGGNKGAASPFGMKGDKFYGGRVVYRDDVLSQNGLIEQYVDVIEASVNNFQGKVYTNIDVGGNKYDVKVEIDITTDETGLKLPAEDFNYEELDLTAFATNYAKLYQIVGEIAKICYKVDNDADSPVDLAETLNGIKYFGFDDNMIGEAIDDTTDNVMEVVYNALSQPGVISLQEKLSTDSTFITATNVTFENIEDNVKTEVKNTIDVETNKVRTEKLFIKDIILDGDDKYMEGIEKKNYVALIYLPKQSVEFDYVSYMITIDKDAEFSAVLSNNGSEINLSKGEGENWSTDEETETAELTYTYKSGENLNQNASVSDVVNTTDLSKFSSPSSLYKIAANSSDYTTYLQKTTLENGDDVLTYKTGNMFILFETDAEFYFSEEIKY